MPAQCVIYINIAEGHKTTDSIRLVFDLRCCSNDIGILTKEPLQR